MKRKNRIRILPMVTMGLVLMGANSCRKEHLTIPPVLTTAAATDITQTTAITGGTITSDGGSTVTERGICWTTRPLVVNSVLGPLNLPPTIEDAKTTDGGGKGSFTSSMIGLTANTTYHIRAYATNSTGTAYGSNEFFTTQQEEIALGLDSNVYHSVTIGTQTWMVENLKETRYNDGTAIRLITDDTAWSNLTMGAYCWYDNGCTNL